MMFDHALDPVTLFLGQSLAIIAGPYALWLWRPVRAVVPLVVVQIAAGIVLGPTVFGRMWPEASAWVLPAGSLANLIGPAWIAVVFFAFLTGLHFDLDLAGATGRGRAFVVTSLMSIVVPAGLGAAAGAWLAASHPGVLGARAEPLTFALGLGVASGVTALPVLGAILREMGLLRHPLGATALGYAAVNDAALWLLMAVVLAVAAGGGGTHVAVVLAGAVGYFAVMVGVARPLLARLFRGAVRARAVSQRDVVALSALLLASALTTELLGLHYIIGAFTFGAVMPKTVAEDVLATFEPFATVVLLPFFFIATGLKTDFDLAAAGVAATFAVMTAVSVAGKMVGTAAPLRAFGRPWREALTLGAFMQCKGLMEIVVLTMLLEAQIIAPSTFSAMILMALATTVACRPLAQLTLGGRHDHA